MRLESGPARTDGLWLLGFTVLCVGFAAWFYYDGKVGWPTKNREQARKHFAGMVQSMPADFGTRPSKQDFEAAIRARVVDITALYEHLGQPFHRAGGAGEQIEYFVSDYGYAEIKVGAGGRIDLAPSQWHDWEHSKSQIEGQYYWALIPAVFAVICAFRTYRAFTLRVVIDDAGMTYQGRSIPFSAMRSLKDFSPKGWVDLYYDAGVGQRKLRIDNQKVDKFDEIIDALCTAKGFEDPRPEPEEDDEDIADGEAKS